MTKLLIPVLALTACTNGCSHSPEPIPSPYSHHFYLSQYVATVLAYGQATGEAVPDEASEAVWNRILRILWTAEDAPCPSAYGEGAECHGLSGTYGEEEYFFWVVSTPGTCVADSSLGHEFIHILHAVLTDDWDVLHKDPRLWINAAEDEAATMQTAEWLAVANGVQLGLCGDYPVITRFGVFDGESPPPEQPAVEFYEETL